MKTEFTYNHALDLINYIGGKPIAVEAQWDRDSRGWFLAMFIFVQKGIFKKIQEVHHLCDISFSKEMSVFIRHRQLTEFPELQLAIEIGEKLKEKYNLEFFFPSPNEPDDSCPRWFEKEKAIECNDCKKLIIPRVLQYSPKEICYNCNLRRERKHELKQNQQLLNGVATFIKSKTILKQIEFASSYTSSTGYEFFKDYFTTVDEESLPIVEIELNRIKIIHSYIKAIIDEKLRHSLPIENNERRARATPRTTVIYDNREVELLKFGNSDHSYLLKIIPFYNVMADAIKQESTYYFQFTNGLNFRDDAFLRYLKYGEKENYSLKQIIDHFAMLEIHEIEVTLDKLIDLECVKMIDNQYVMTEKGHRLV